MTEPLCGYTISTNTDEFGALVDDSDSSPLHAVRRIIAVMRIKPAKIRIGVFQPLVYST
jgi:hypothetical protein